MFFPGGSAIAFFSEMGKLYSPKQNHTLKSSKEGEQLTLEEAFGAAVCQAEKCFLNSKLFRFFSEGYKSNRYYWEVLVLFRKLAMTLCIVFFANDIVNAVYSLIFVIQGTLLIHLLLHPHVSGRQHRLELYSISSILGTLFVGLYLLEGENSDEVSYVLSIILLIAHIFVILVFGFFILRGLVRQYSPDTWSKITRFWKRKAPAPVKKNRAKLTKITEFFQEVSQSSPEDRVLLNARVDKWWKNAPNYKRKRLIQMIRKIGGSSFEAFRTPSQQNLVENEFKEE